MTSTAEIVKNQWDRVCARIQESESDRFASRWLSKIIPDSIDESGKVHLLAKTGCICDLVKRDYADRILSFWREENESVRDLDLSLIKQQELSLPLTIPSAPKQIKSPVVIHQERDPESVMPPLNPNYTFDSFVVGSSNQFAYAAARRVAEDDSFSFSSLYIHGGSGQGKTHLMQAIAWKMRELYPDKQVLYLSCEQFCTQFLKSLREGSTEQLRDMYRSVDVLLVDDIQHICGKPKTLEEFFSIFNDFIMRGKKIILAALSAPQDLCYVKDPQKHPEAVGVAQRLKTRMAQGLVVDILPPTYELRLGILKQKMKNVHIPVPAEVLDFLAHHISTNVRELEGALNRLVGKAELLGETITLSKVPAILKDLLRISEKEVSIKEIQEEICSYYQISLTELKSVRRERRIARPRQLAMYLAKTLTQSSLPDIGYAFERDHTTVMHAVKMMEGLLERDKKLASDVEVLSCRLKGNNL